MSVQDFRRLPGFVWLICLAFVLGQVMPAAAMTAPTPPANPILIVPAGQPVQIAVMMWAGWTTAQDTYDAVDMAIQSFGTIHGWTVQANPVDTPCNPTDAENAATAVISNTQNAGVVGPLCSNSTVGAAPVLNAAQVVMISPSNTARNSVLYPAGPQVFNRVVLADPMFTPWAAKVFALPSVQSWRAEFETLYGRPPDEVALYAYDATRLLLNRIQAVSQVNPGGDLEIDRRTLAAAVRQTSDFQGVTGRIALSAQGDRLDTTIQRVWTEPFTTTLKAGWSWINEDAGHWSLTARPGFLRLITQTGDHNLLVQPAPLGDFEISTRLVFTPTEDFQQAGLLVYKDSQNFFKLGQSYCDVPAPTCLGNAIYFNRIEAGQPVGSNYVMTTTLTGETYLRLLRVGTALTATVSTNGTEWQIVGVHTIGFTPLQVGLAASNLGGQPASELPADFDSFVLVDSTYHLYAPLINKNQQPEK